MPRILGSFLVKLILTVVISIFIGFQIAKIEFGQAEHSFRKILGEEKVVEDSALEAKIQEILNGQDGEYSIYVKDLKPEGKRNVCINCDQPYEAASLYKVFLMGAVYQAIQDGKLTLDTEISAKMSHLTDVYGGVDFGYEAFGDDEVIEYSVQEALQRVASISDNFAALMLAEKVGWGSVQLIANQIGTTQTSIQNPITTSSEDVGLLFEKLYKGEVVSLQFSEATLDLLSQSKLNNRIPAYLPEDVKVSHKTGELAGVRNDAGVVFAGGNPYVIVMMSKNLRGEDDGVENLAQISKAVYEYYASNPNSKDVK